MLCSRWGWLLGLPDNWFHLIGTSNAFMFPPLKSITKDTSFLASVFCQKSQQIWFNGGHKKLFLWSLMVFSCDQAALQMVFSVCPSVRLSVCLSHLFDYVPIIVSSWNFQELLPMTNVRSMQKVKVRGQRSRSQRSQPNLTVSGL